MRILLIEDDQRLAQEIHRGLTDVGYEVDMTQSHDDGERMAGSQEYDTIIVEMKPSSRLGQRTCQTLRKRGVRSPVILVAPETNTADKVAGLDSGADDYLTIPFALDEMLARIRSLLRRTHPHKEKELVCGDLTMNMVQHRVTRAGKELSLTPKEFALLEFFLQNPNRVLNREQISTHVWGSPQAGTSNTIDVYVSMLRKKIDRGFQTPLIRTIVGYGYMFGEEI